MGALPQSANATRPLLLVVEDERLIAKDLQRRLEKLGYEVPRTVASADEAIAAASERCPDLVLMDIRIEGDRDGIETAEIMRRRFHAPVVFLSAFADDEMLARAEAARPSGYLVKPVKTEDLRATIGLALARHEARHVESCEPLLGADVDNDAAIGTLAGGVAHAVNNPLSFVLTNVELVGDLLREHAAHDPWADEARMMLDDARIGAERVARVVADLQSFAHPRPTMVSRLNVDLAISAALRIAAADLTEVDVVNIPRAHALVSGDEQRFTRVLVNLLQNAAHAMTKSATKRLRIASGMSTDGRVVVEVADSGTGIPAAVQPRIFEPFFTTRAFGRGCGLGLSICQGIVASMGGTMTFETEEGTGTIFRIALPPVASVTA